MWSSRRTKSISQTLKRWAVLHKEAMKDWRYWVVIISISGLVALRYTLQQIGMYYFITDLFYSLSLYWVPLMYCAWTFDLSITVTSALWVLILNSLYLIIYTGSYFRVFELSQLLVTTALAVYIGVVIAQKRSEEQKAKLFARRAIANREDERKRISRDLHDDTIQSMVLVCRQLDSVRYFSQNLPQTSSDELLNARNNVEQTVDRLRVLATDLRPTILDDLGLVVSIRKLVTDIKERAGLDVRFEVTGKERRLNIEVEVALFRITQEALHNIEHHARPTRVLVTLNLGNSEVKIKIQDNGVGFEVPRSFDEVSYSKHLGILGMIERAEQLDGRLDINSEVGKGTIVTARIPLAPPISGSPPDRLLK